MLGNGVLDRTFLKNMINWPIIYDSRIKFQVFFINQLSANGTSKEQLTAFFTSIFSLGNDQKNHLLSPSLSYPTRSIKPSKRRTRGYRAGGKKMMLSAK